MAAESAFWWIKKLCIVLGKGLITLQPQKNTKHTNKKTQTQITVKKMKNVKRKSHEGGQTLSHKFSQTPHFAIKKSKTVIKLHSDQKSPSCLHLFAPHCVLQLLLVHLSLIFVFFTSSFGTHGISISDARQEKSVLPPPFQASKSNCCVNSLCSCTRLVLTRCQWLAAQPACSSNTGGSSR